jgi:hypothetical protein
MESSKNRLVGAGLLILLIMTSTSCFRYSMTGTSIPPDVSSVYIPFFPDQSNSGLGNLSNLLNEALVDRFVNSTRLQLANNQGNADAILDGSIVGYENRPYTIGGNEEANENRVSITVRATFKYADEDKAEWDSQRFQNHGFYDPGTNPIEGENTAAETALRKIADNMFNEAVGQW